MHEEELKRVLSRMQGLCARREYCTSDIRRKLLTRRETPLTEQEAGQILTALQREKYLDDARYAGAFARDKASLAAWGTAKIRYALRAKGISDEDISLALESIEPERSQERLRKLLESRCRNLADDPKCRQKLLRFALARGYDYDEINEVLSTYFWPEE